MEPNRVMLPVVNREINECYRDARITAYVGWKMSPTSIIPNQHTTETIATICILVNFTCLSKFIYIYIYILLYSHECLFPVACYTCVISPTFPKILACRNTSPALKYMNTEVHKIHSEQ